MRAPNTPGPQPDEIIRRLRAWPVSGWSHGERIARTRRTLQELADIAAARRGHAVPVVPALSPHALGSQLAVLVADARRAGVDAGEVDSIVRQLGADLGAVR